MDMEHIKLYNLSEESNKTLLSRYTHTVKTARVYIILLLYLVVTYKTMLLAKADVA
jgi:hypothetical protein